MAARGERLDVEMVRQGLVESRARAQALILAGVVQVEGVPASRAGDRVFPGVVIEVVGPSNPFVSRGGLKLDHALTHFGVDPTGLVCADLGASTGGFTDCLLQRGATRVYAVDVGYGQFAWKLRQDPRVVLYERTNVRHLEDLPEPIELVVGDLSFISLQLILPTVKRIGAPGARVLVLVKPQFEVGRQRVGKGGLVSDPAARADAILSVGTAARELGFGVSEPIESPLRGARAGNLEYLLQLTLPV